MPRVFICDDAVDWLTQIRALLEAKGYVVETAFLGREAALVLRDRPRFDVIVLDYLIGDMTGEELLDLIPPEKQAPVILVTGAVLEMPKKLPAIVRHIIEKPFTQVNGGPAVQLLEKIADLTGPGTAEVRAMS